MVNSERERAREQCTRRPQKRGRKNEAGSVEISDTMSVKKAPTNVDHCNVVKNFRTDVK